MLHDPPLIVVRDYIIQVNYAIIMGGVFHKKHLRLSAL